MPSFRSLFAPRRKPRCYAWLDGAGICRALQQSRVPPQGAGWVEVSESRLVWLQRPLPASARIPQVVAHSVAGHPLAA